MSAEVTDIEVSVPVTVAAINLDAAIATSGSQTVEIPVTIDGETTTLRAAMLAAPEIAAPVTIAETLATATITIQSAASVTIDADVGRTTWVETFETISKNLKKYPATFTYDGDKLQSVQYATPSGTITKTLAYNGIYLQSVTLSGAIPDYVATVKTFGYSTQNKLISINYS
jgi:hypothetical protein